mgnify:CR=1 FL=1
MYEPITRQQAIDLLYTRNPNNSAMSTTVMDEFGNYVFPTDVVLSNPSNICGSSFGCEALLIIENSNKVQ